MPNFLLGVKCPPISEDEDLTISGNTEDATYNDYIHFECVSPNKKIDREQKHIHCNEKGEWSLPPPKCIGSFHLFFEFNISINYLFRFYSK